MTSFHWWGMTVELWRTEVETSTEITPCRPLFLRRGRRRLSVEGSRAESVITLNPPSNLRKSQSTADCGKSTGNLNRTECLYCLGYSCHTPRQENNTLWCYYNSLNTGETNVFLKNSYYFLAICFGVCLTLKEASLEFWKTRKLKEKKMRKNEEEQPSIINIVFENCVLGLAQCTACATICDLLGQVSNRDRMFIK